METSYWDVDGHAPRAPEPTLRQGVVDVLEADAATPPRHLEPVIVVGRPRADRRRHTARRDRAARRRHRGRAPVDDGRGRDDRAARPPPPIGCHRLVATAGGRGGDDRRPPATMPRPAARRRPAGLFVPAYALWERRRRCRRSPTSPLAAALPPTSASTSLSTLPLYAAFLDEPFDPSPYAPVSRLHWNEVYLDDAVLAGGAGPRTYAHGDFIDWRLARRRRRQLLAAAAISIRTSSRHRPLRRRPSRRRRLRPIPPDGRPPTPATLGLVRAQPPARPVPRRPQLAGVEGDGRAALALDLPIGSHPTATRRGPTASCSPPA